MNNSKGNPCNLLPIGQKGRDGGEGRGQKPAPFTPSIVAVCVFIFSRSIILGRRWKSIRRRSRVLDDSLVGLVGEIDVPEEAHRVGV